MTIKTVTRMLGSVLLTQLVLLPDLLYSQSDFYRGKTIRIVHGRDAGGSGDLRVKALVPFLQKYIPGNPTIVNEFMPGGGGRKAGNYIYGSATPDGLTIGNAGSGMVSSAVLGETGVQYDIDKLVFLGSPYSSTQLFFLDAKGNRSNDAGETPVSRWRARRCAIRGAHHL
jgi:tripartite-type tricarboxylate transporter receptor subunit TctC